ncbi:Carbonyl reductase family member 4 [Hondaea fermentalgiana]|uniref:Carbonyl reductase family member 4 n=1 Tax=Hondaea fermentalgiana TaxID=2315210 RepID=A0A2R5GVB6_9STRA|nr:Carbonyl reductase family member 4 [Hondaea fermentalgiana]|eukprot:GBG34790.1 Carbonyl reductase family member 4 [Hondaea fermentalgiana]
MSQRVANVARHLTTSAKKGVCLVVGAGDATGGAIARRFAKEGYTTAVVRRNKEPLEDLVKQIQIAGGNAVAFACDARKEEQVVDLVQKIEKDLGPIEIAVHNIGANMNFPITETTTRKYTKIWEMAALTAFHMGREVARVMTPRKQGTIIITGATASLRGGSGFAAFAGAKHAKRALAQAMARELGPKGIHVAHTIIDGPIETNFVRDIWGEDNFKNLQDNGGLLLPDEIAKVYLDIHNQHPSAWTFELDLRPYCEKW